MSSPPSQYASGNPQMTAFYYSFPVFGVILLGVAFALGCFVAILCRQRNLSRRQAMRIVLTGRGFPPRVERETVPVVGEVVPLHEIKVDSKTGQVMHDSDLPLDFTPVILPGQERPGAFAILETPATAELARQQRSLSQLTEGGREEIGEASPQREGGPSVRVVQRE